MCSSDLDSAGRVLVMPFENTGRDRRYFWLGEAAAVVLTDALTARGVDAIPREERRAAFDRLQVPATAVLTDATTFRIAQLVGAAYVLVGEFQVEGTTLTVRTRAIGVEAGVLRGAVAQGGPLGEFFSIFDALSEQAVRVTGLPARPSSGSGGLATASGVAPTLRSGAVPPSVGVLESYTKGVLAEDPRTA